MNLQFTSRTTIAAIIIMVLSINQISSQTTTNNNKNNDLNTVILTLDQQFWDAYNSCNLQAFSSFFVQDFEFYHDKGGLTSGLTKMMELVSNGLCGNKNIRIRREAVKGSINVYPLNNYGAIITGEHMFYITENEAKEVPTEIAKFTHVWQQQNNEWKMTRVLSYDHQPAPQNTDKTTISLSLEILKNYVGKYQAPQTGLVQISIANNALKVNAGKMEAIIFPETENMFFNKENPLTFEFIKGSNNKILKLIVREKGKVVEEATKL
ncbi:nuclear transport factor 2 family protein [Aquimarina sp. D1M17]|uniref:nuclear transport factor 2 family protein n=1 Tax=Aquimarina acroporae TaxID=2937283 RepID=UPI0020BDE736|nr:nuclear transport factor 2 family protein [Aquimarina acroporae]MCK8522861.1 nuclear transport factor 2 family protein [Aquimarina acroporae]